MSHRYHLLLIEELATPTTIDVNDRTGLEALRDRYPKLFMGGPLPWKFEVGAGTRLMLQVHSSQQGLCLASVS
jgi:hypothetical protein